MIALLKAHDDAVYENCDVEDFMTELLDGEITSTAEIYHAIKTKFPGITPDQITECVEALLSR